MDDIIKKIDDLYNDLSIKNKEYLLKLSLLKDEKKEIEDITKKVKAREAAVILREKNLKKIEDLLSLEKEVSTKQAALAKNQNKLNVQEQEIEAKRKEIISLKKEADASSAQAAKKMFNLKEERKNLDEEKKNLRNKILEELKEKVNG